MFSCKNSFVYSLGLFLVVGVDCFLYRSGLALYTPGILGGFLTLFFSCIIILACSLLIQKKKKNLI